MSATHAERLALFETAQQVLDRHRPLDAVHALVDREPGPGPDDGLWRVMTELGWTGVGLPETAGGLGCGVAEEALLCEALGAHLTGTAFVPTAVGAATIAASPEPDRDVLAAVAAGRERLAVCLEPVTGPADLTRTPRAEPVAAGMRIDGPAGLTWEAADADRLVVVAFHHDDPVIALIDAAAPGVRIVPARPVDRTRRLAMVELHGVTVAPELILARGAAGERLAALMIDRMALCLAADCVGGLRRLLDLTTEYANRRIQFGRPIGSFQAIKHRCADMLVAAESARSLLTRALSGAAEPDEGGAMTSAAKAYCADVYATSAGAAVQIHGGIGFTWEGHPQLFLKRAKLTQQLCGSSDWHRERAAGRLFGLATADC